LVVDPAVFEHAKDSGKSRRVNFDAYESWMLSPLNSETIIKIASEVSENLVVQFGEHSLL